jgi:asparagine synthase (glutamine-hydrolysing)
MGFGVPLATWLRGSLKEWGEDLLSYRRLQHQGVLNAELVRQIWHEHQSGRQNWEHHLWDVLMFQAWYDAWHGYLS